MFDCNAVSSCLIFDRNESLLMFQSSYVNSYNKRMLKYLKIFGISLCDYYTLILSPNS